MLLLLLLGVITVSRLLVLFAITGGLLVLTSVMAGLLTSLVLTFDDRDYIWYTGADDDVPADICEDLLCFLSMLSLQLISINFIFYVIPGPAGFIPYYFILAY